MELQRLEGKTALITGGGSGFGRATALRFATEGAEHLVLVDLRPERLDQVVAELEVMGTRATGVRADIGLSADCQRVVDAAVEADGRLDILISNAAAWTEEAFLDMKEESWNRVLAVNLTASFLLGQAAGRVMRDQGGGVIAYTASISSLGGVAALRTLRRHQGRHRQPCPKHGDRAGATPHPRQLRKPGACKHAAVA